jgi:hypothetical protein
MFSHPQEETKMWHNERLPEAAAERARTVDQRGATSGRVQVACVLAMLVAGAVSTVGCQTADDARPREPSSAPAPLGHIAEAVTGPDAGPTSPAIGSFAIYATQAIELNSGSSITGCAVGVENAAGPFLGSAAAYFNSGAKIDPAQTLYASSVYLNSGAEIGPLAATQVTAHSGSSHGAVSSFPVMPAPPALLAATAGTMAVTLNSGGAKRLAAGAYGSVTVNSGATLTLTGGTYVFSSLTLNSGATLGVTTATSLSVTGAASFNSGSYAGPQLTTGLTARALSLYFDSAANVNFNSGARVRALVVATNAKITVNTSSFTGAIAAAQVLLNSGATVTCEDGLAKLGGCAASCDDGNDCTSDVCSGGVCGHAPNADGSNCSDGSACTRTDVCVLGQCVGGNAVVCGAADACHVVGTCDSATGLCSNPAAADGTSCALVNASAACQGGACALTACNNGFADCNANVADGCETVTTSTSNCGGCGIVCAGGANATPACNGATCGLACAMGFADCDGDPSNGCEVNTQTDLDHCGACGTTCQFHDTCQAGSCSSAVCQTGYADCNQTPNECETSLTTDPNNCGGCGMACSFPQAAATCTGGACEMGSCNSGYADCDQSGANGCEVHSASDAANCGACGNVCPTGQICASGRCAPACGTQGGACCSTGAACSGNLMCATGSNTCQPCGGTGQLCCAAGATTCQDGDACLPGRCFVFPGQLGSEPTFECNPSVCEACGGEGQICCASNSCSGGLNCIRPSGVSSAECHAYGAPGEPCGPNLECLPNLSCILDSTVKAGTCSACGHSGQACCPAGEVNDGTTLEAASGPFCIGNFACSGGTCACGGAGQVCCGPNTNCAAVCTSLGCEPGATQLVCGGSTCNTGLTCTPINQPGGGSCH